jgi:general secretion pathway protein D
MTLPRAIPTAALFFVLSLGLGVRGQLAPVSSDPVGGFSNFQNTPVASLLDTYEQVSGKHLIRDVTLAGLPPVSLNATGVSKGEFLKLVESTMLLNGIAFVPVDDHTMKVVNVSGGRNPRSEGVRLYANAEDIPKDDSIVSYYMPLSYLNPTEAVTIFTAQAPVHVYGAYIPAPTAQAVIVTEGAQVVRELIALKELIDVPPARVASEFVQLTRADAEKVADLLNKLLHPEKDPAAGAPIAVPPYLGNQSPLSNERDLISGPAQIVADPRSNRILLVTRPVNLPFLEKMIAELDRPDNFMQPQQRALKYVLAQDILPALEGALAQGKEEQDAAKQDDKTAATSTPNSNPVQSQPAAAASQNSANGTTSGSDEQPLTDPAQNNVPTIVTIGKTRILADNRSNSIIVFGTPDAVNRVFEVIDELDHKPLQVYLASVIGQLTVSEGEEFGIDLLQKFQHAGSYGLATGVVNTSAGTTVANVPEPGGLLTSTIFPLASGATIYAALGNTLDAYVRALETTNRFKVVSRPSVYTMNNKAALISSGSKIPIPASTTSGFDSGNNGLVTTSSTSYENVQLQLSIIPVINANHQVTLRIRQSNDSVAGSQTISGNAIPIIDTQNIDTEVTVPDKSTIVIGGLISDTTERDTSGIPWLSDIPVLGYLFKDTKKSKTRSELIIMISPSVVDTDADQVVVNEAEKGRTILGREAEASSQPVLPSGGSVTTETTTEVRGSHREASGLRAPGSETTTVIQSSPISPTHSLVPAASTAAPNVSNGKLPKDAPPVPSPATLP